MRSLTCVHGIDINPFAAAIARFRLLLAAMQAADIKRLADAPAFALQIACGDSLLHSSMIRDAPATQTGLDMAGLNEAAAPTKKNRGGMAAKAKTAADDEACDHVYAAENLDVLRRLLQRGQYHAVVANPPYITPKDPILNERYRKRFGSCHMKYSLSVPFLEQIFLLAAPGGFTGQITANSFMKREFGTKLIESFFPTVDLTHVIDTSGAYIPGHGTPTVILFGRRRDPVAPTVRAVLGIRGEPITPADPTQGLVWTAITQQVDHAGSASDYVSVADTPRPSFHLHPWSIGGGGAAELKEQLDSLENGSLNDCIKSVGFSAILGQDEAFGAPFDSTRISLLRRELRRPIIEGDHVRDYELSWATEVIFPYSEAIDLLDEPDIRRWLWNLRTTLGSRADFSKRTYAECGRPFWEYHQIPIDRNRIPFSIAYAEVATHNHFVLDRGGKAFKQTAPVITLSADATEQDHLELLGILTSTIACFWLQQSCHNKGRPGA
ncbi:MAG: BREX-2 system adenine-specific DNA-methyltransferase PglX, partial [Planctomycetota bacterium]